MQTPERAINRVAEWNGSARGFKPPVSYRLLLTLLTIFVFSTLLLASDPAYPPSPLDLHRDFRVRFLARKPAADQIREFAQRTGDHSFDSLLDYRRATAEALRLERQAIKAWDGGERENALRKYRLAFEIFQADGATSESAFCLYYMAEILSDLEQYGRALLLLEQADSLAVGCVYLGALIADSRGYCLWFQDRLPASTRSFSRASGLWQQLDCPDGTVLCWNNLALLCEEMGLARRASDCYRQSLRRADPGRVSSEILFYLHGNYAAFLLERGDSRGAEEHLAKAKQLASVSPDEFVILRWKIEGAKSSLPDVEPLPDELPSIRIEKLLLLGDRAAARKEQSAHDRYRQALELSREAGLRRDTRKCLLKLGRWLESESRHTEAAALYLGGFQAEESFHTPELFFPYSRTVSPLLDGWIRALVESGAEWQALQGIHGVSELRQSKARVIVQTTPTAFASGSALAAFAQVAALENRETSTTPGSTSLNFRGARTSEITWPDLRLKGPGDTILELWPDGDTVYAWGRGRHGRFFRSCRLSAPCAELVDQVISSLHAASSSLPQPPPQALLREFHRSLWMPLESEIGGQAILLIPHKELQNLPFEMLRDDEDNWLALRYDFSYLPFLPSAPKSPKSAGIPTAVVPSGVSGVSTPADERAFFGLFLPEVRVANRLEFDESQSPSWVHVSAHMRLDDDFWAASTLQDDTGQLNILGFLKTARDCSLVSLGVCDAGNGYTSHSPYWLGFTELFVSHGVDAVVVNRWRMDDLSSAIYMDFYRLALAGVPMDQALGRARRNFLRRTLRRGLSSIPGNHPFFWAGVTYVGLPGQRLYPDRPGGCVLLLINGLLLCGAIAGLARWRTSERCREDS